MCKLPVISYFLLSKKRRFAGNPRLFLSRREKTANLSFSFTHVAMNKLFIIPRMVYRFPGVRLHIPGISLCKVYVFFCLLFSSVRGYFTSLSAAGQARRPSVHDECRDPGRAPWRCTAHSTSLNWLFFSRGCVPPWLSRVGMCGWKTPQFVVLFR